jgi:hypothetical protein
MGDAVKVGELIEYLQKLDPDLLVVVQGYESGYQEVLPTNLHQINVGPVNPDAEDWEGDRETDSQGTPALLISR